MTRPKSVLTYVKECISQKISITNFVHILQINSSEGRENLEITTKSNSNN